MVACREDPATIEGRIYGGLRRMIALRKDCAAFAGADTSVVDTGNGHVFGYVRHGEGQVFVLANFSEQAQVIGANTLRTRGLAYELRDLISGETIGAAHDLTLDPYRVVWLVAGR